MHHLTSVFEAMLPWYVTHYNSPLRCNSRSVIIEPKAATVTMCAQIFQVPSNGRSRILVRSSSTVTALYTEREKKGVVHDSFCYSTWTFV
eukprot:3972550-Amphidinium_carterae.1